MKLKTKIFCLLVMGAVGVFGVLPSVPVEADTLSDLQAQQRENANKIAQKQSEIAGYEAELKRIAGEAVTYANEIRRLDVEAQALQAEIDISTIEYNRLMNEIAINEKKIADNKDALGLVLLDLYNIKNVSLIERLASSQSLSDFVSREARLDNISGVITETVNKIETLKAQLEKEKAEVQRVLDELNAQKSRLMEMRAEQQRLLNYTKQQQKDFTNKKSTAQKEKNQLEQEQQNVLRRIMEINGGNGMTAGDPKKGGYPYSSSCPKAKNNGTQYADKWGMYICECVSYVAWRVSNAYGNMPKWGGNWNGGLRGGNAKEWLHNAGIAGVPKGTTPKVGSVGVITSGTYGHVVWVEAVSGSKIYISQYNYAIAAINYVKGEYSEMWVNASAYNGFIYFGDWKK